MGSDLDTKPSDLSFLQDSLDLSHDEIHRSLQANMAANRSNGHAVDLNPMEFIEQNGGSGSGTGGAAASANAAAAASAVGGGAAANNGTNHHMPPHPPFELDFDKFDMLSEFPDLTDHYNNSALAMIHHGASGPLLSSAMANTQQPHQTASNQQPAVHGQGGAQAGQNNSAKHSHRHNITDYSPDWAWSDVSRFVEISELTRMISI